MTERSPAIRLISAGATERALDYPSLIQALREGHRAGVAVSERLLIVQPGSAEAQDHLLTYAAWQRGRALGVKLASIFPGNAGKNLPTIASIFVLFDGQSGAPLAVIDANPLTQRKTGADSALGADYLARRDACTLLMVGAGRQAPAMIAAHRSIRPGLSRVLIWNRTAQAAALLAGHLKSQGIDAAAVADLEAAAGTADVICCATASRTPVLKGAWVKPGTHVDLVGSFSPEMREADDALMRRARIYVDSRWFTLGVAGDLLQPIRDGVISEADIAGDLFDLAQGKAPGRGGASEITVFKNGGGGHLDLMTAQLIYARVVRKSSRGKQDAAAN